MRSATRFRRSAGARAHAGHRRVDERLSVAADERHPVQVHPPIVRESPKREHRRRLGLVAESAHAAALRGFRRRSCCPLMTQTAPAARLESTVNARADQQAVVVEPRWIRRPTQLSLRLGARAARGCGRAVVVGRRAAGSLRHEPVARSAGHRGFRRCGTLRHDRRRAVARTSPVRRELGQFQRSLRRRPAHRGHIRHPRRARRLRRASRRLGDAVRPRRRRHRRARGRSSRSEVPLP